MYGRGYYYGSPSILQSFDSVGAILIALVAAVIALCTFIAWCRMFSKADMPWERLFVPIYGNYAMYSIADCGGIFWINVLGGVAAGLISAFMRAGIVMTIFYILVIVLHCVYCVRLAKVFGKGVGYGIGLILLYPFFIMGLGFGSAEYGDYSRGKDVIANPWHCTCGTTNPASRLYCTNCGKEKPYN